MAVQFEGARVSNVVLMEVWRPFRVNEWQCWWIVESLHILELNLVVGHDLYIIIGPFKQSKCRYTIGQPQYKTR